MSETNQNLGTLTWFDEGGFYWLDGELTNQLQLYPVKKMEWDDGITDHSGAPEKLVFGDVTFTKLYPDDNVYQTDIIGAEGAYSLMDIDGTGYYTGFMGSPLKFNSIKMSFENTGYTTLCDPQTIAVNGLITQVLAVPNKEGTAIDITYWYWTDTGETTDYFLQTSSLTVPIEGAKVVYIGNVSGIITPYVANGVVGASAFFDKYVNSTSTKMTFMVSTTPAQFVGVEYIDAAVIGHLTR